MEALRTVARGHELTEKQLRIVESGLESGEKAGCVVAESWRAVHRGDELTCGQPRAVEGGLQRCTVASRFLLSMLKRCGILAKGVVVVQKQHRNTRE